LRLFVAIDIEDAIRERIARFLEGICGFAPEARWVKPESLHITLKFIGEQSEEELPKIKQAMKEIQGQEVELRFRGHGFFPNARRPRIFWIGVEAGENLAALAGEINRSLAGLGVPKEEHSYNPHITLARMRGSQTRGRSGEKSEDDDLRRLQEKLAALSSPEFGEMTAREFFLYQSQSAPGGSKYTKLERFALSSPD
jgi:RNA 2',3'-cyclic 3'-phosphodiesterase